MIMSLYKKISKISDMVPEKTAIIFEEKEIVYSQLHKDIDGFIAYFLSLGVRKGDRIGWLGLNHYVALEIFFACAGIGAIFVPINWRLSSSEMEKVLYDCKPTLIFYSEERFVDDLQYDVATFFNICTQKINVSFGKTQKNKIVKDLKNDVLISYTSGSTGEPKGVVLSQQAILSNSVMSVEAHALNENDIVLNVLPIFHVGGLNILVTPALLLGATVLLHGKFDLDKTIEDLPHCNSAIFVPTILREIISDPRLKSKNLESIKTLSIGSTIVPVDLIKETLAFGVNIIQLYGSTEVTPFAIHQRIEGSRTSIGSIGKVGAECSIKLVSESGHEVTQGETGEICVKGKNLFSRYYGQKESAFSFGWFKTGDLASRDCQGNYWFADRIKNVIISGGENIYPAEIEKIALKHSKFKVVAAVAKSDLKWGEVPVLFIESKDEPYNNLLSHKAWKEIAGYKRPHEIKFLRIFPRNSMGKIKLDELRAIANGKDGQS